ncbi:VanZ family protein [Propionibacteriaceae bacterium Y1685]|uniref:VanZ family protein n=1 Tax=Microlunatus sp. Y1700 TaxID=3418487 RepID=UPI003B7C63A0
MRRRLLITLAILAGVIQVVGLYRPTGIEGAPAIPGLDKAAHLLMFGVPVLLLLLAACRRRWVLPVFAAHAMVSEVIQHRFLPSRSGDPYDLLADLIGIGLATLAAWLITRRNRRRVAAE